MRISVKGRYALAAAIDLAEHGAVKGSKGEFLTVLSIAERLGLSKIYLEQTFAQLKRAGLLLSVKGSQGGYQLARRPHELAIRDLLAPVENALFETSEPTVSDKAPEIDRALRLAAFEPLDQAVGAVLDHVTLASLLDEVERQRAEHTPMYYI
jgi:Rrf2 family protein